jgi:hypothetical protein
MEDLTVEIRPAGRAKVDLIIRDTKGTILLTDQANLASAPRGLLCWERNGKALNQSYQWPGLAEEEP